MLLKILILILFCCSELFGANSFYDNIKFGSKLLAESSLNENYNLFGIRIGMYRNYNYTPIETSRPRLYSIHSLPIKSYLKIFELGTDFKSNNFETDIYYSFNLISISDTDRDRYESKIGIEHTSIFLDFINIKRDINTNFDNNWLLMGGSAGFDLNHDDWNFLIPSANLSMGFSSIKLDSKAVKSLGKFHTIEFSDVDFRIGAAIDFGIKSVEIGIKSNYRVMFGDKATLEILKSNLEIQYYISENKLENGDIYDIYKIEKMISFIFKAGYDIFRSEGQLEKLGAASLVIEINPENIFN